VADRKTVIVTGASRGIGAAIARTFLDRDYNVLATSLNCSGVDFSPSPRLGVVDGDIGQEATAETVTKTAIAQFGSIDHVVNNAGTFSAKPFTEYTIEEFRRFASVNLEGFLFITQRAVRHMLSQGTGAA
jgi:NAD(P)-dependent dehydrogenase (short-subunit alcohol dehydrogenase family)